MSDSPSPLPRGLYVITPADLQGDALLAAVNDALAGGAVLVQYRVKHREHSQCLREARQLHALCANRGAGLIINDNVELAAEVGAGGVHLGRDDTDIRSARQALGDGAWVGVSCYNDMASAREAQRKGADYVAFGSFFPSAVKPDAVRAPLTLLHQGRRSLSLPLCAIGGITPANGAALVTAGAQLLAVITGVFGARDITSAAHAYACLFGTAPQGRRQT